MTLLEERQVVSVEEAGRVMGIGRSAAYSAAARGDIPAIRIGKRLVVPVRALERLLDSAGRGQDAGS